MIVFLYGPDDYRRERKKRELIAEFEKKHSGLGRDNFDLSEEGAAGKLADFLENQSIFEPAKLAVLTGLFSSSPGRETIQRLQGLSGDKNTTLLISEAEEPPKALAFLLSKKTGILSQSFPYLSSAAWVEFIQEETRRLGVALAPRALRFLAEVYKNDTWRLMTELGKLSLLPRREIRQEDLERLDVELTPDFWETVRGLTNPVLGRRLLTLEGLLARNEPAGKIFSILAYRWPEKLPKFAAYDSAVKSGRCDYEEVLVDLLIT